MFYDSSTDTLGFFHRWQFWCNIKMLYLGLAVKPPHWWRWAKGCVV